MKRLVLAAVAVLALGLGTAFAAKTDVTLGVRLEPPHLDPTEGAAAATDEVVYANVFEGLTRIGPDGEVKPALAKSWEVSDDGLTYTFHLQEGVKFHDGTDFDASDVVFSFERAMAPDSANSQKALFSAIGKVEAADPRTVRITLTRPEGSLPFNLGWGDAVIVAPESAAANKTNPVGTGPFRFSDWTKGDSITLVRNDAYWGEPVKLDRATFKIIADPSAAFASMMAGDIDGYPIYPAPENLAQFEADPRFSVVVGTTEGETILAMNNAKKPFDDPRVRKAVSHAIDRQAIIDGALFGYGTPIGSHFAPHHPAYVDLTGMYPHDVEKAKALLTEAGYPDGFKTTLTLPPSSGRWASRPRSCRSNGRNGWSRSSRGRTTT
jgi:peptide/nickel transport system substrate-binding protein